MIILRFLSVFLICFLLLSPFFKREVSRNEKPVFVIGVDNSLSVVANADSANLRKNINTKIASLKEQLKEKFDVVTLGFSDSVKPLESFGFSGFRTNISTFFSYLNNNFDGRKIAAVALLSDGISNKGSNPQFQTLAFKAPVFTLGVGDTTYRKDIAVRNTRTNELVFLNDGFPVRAEINTTNCRGENVKVSISENGKLLEQKSLAISDSRSFNELEFTVTATTPGVHHYVIITTPATNELTLANNSRDLFVDVLDSRRKIALIYAAAHPDLGAIVECMKTDNNLEVKSYSVTEVAALNIKDFSMVILHQVPSLQGNEVALLQKIKQSNVPAMFIIGSQSKTSALFSYDPAVSIENKGGNTTEAQAIVNSTFDAFVISPDLQLEMQGWPPLKVPFGSYNTGSGLNVLAWQRIGSVSTKLPLIAFNTQQKVKNAYWFGEGFWRWRLSNFNHNENHDFADELLNKTIRLVANTEDKRRFRVSTPSKTFAQGEHITFSAEYYNPAYEPVNDKSGTIFIKGGEGFSKEFELQKSGRGYVLDAGVLSPGNYSWHAEIKGAEQGVADGKFIVGKSTEEWENLRADFDLLRAISSKTDGKFYPFSQIDKMSEYLKQMKAKQVIYTETKYADFIDLKWYFAALVVLLSAEWFIRKREGSI